MLFFYKKSFRLISPIVWLESWISKNANLLPSTLSFCTYIFGSILRQRERFFGWFDELELRLTHILSALTWNQSRRITLIFYAQITMLSNQISLGSRYWALRSSAFPSPTIALTLRRFAQVASAQDPKPPVALFGLDGTYASALVSQLFSFWSLSISTA